MAADGTIEITSLAYRTEAMLLGLSGSELTDRGDYVVVRTPRNPGFWWGNYLLFRTGFGAGDAATRVETFRVEFPDAKHVAIGVDTTDGVVGVEHELHALGLELERNTVMTAGRPQLRAPGRPNTDATYRLLADDTDFTQLLSLTMAVNVSESRDQKDFTRKKIEAERAVAEAGHAAWFGAFDGGLLTASLGLVFDERGVARFQNVQTHPDHRERGLASTLVHRASTYGLTELGAHTLVMVADPEYLAIRVYRALGFADTEIQLQLTKPAP